MVNERCVARIKRRNLLLFQKKRNNSPKNKITDSREKSTHSKRTDTQNTLNEKNVLVKTKKERIVQTKHRKNLLH